MNVAERISDYLGCFIGVSSVLVLIVAGVYFRRGPKSVLLLLVTAVIAPYLFAFIAEHRIDFDLIGNEQRIEEEANVAEIIGRIGELIQVVAVGAAIVILSRRPKPIV